MHRESFDGNRWVCSLDSTRTGAWERQNGELGGHRNLIARQRNFQKTSLKSNSLRGKFNHNCVLFVQHPPEKARTRAVRSGSFIACAGSFGNCDVATEGGIPRSSRFRWRSEERRVGKR